MKIIPIDWIGTDQETYAVEFPAPLVGYSVSANMAIEFQPLIDGSISVWDNASDGTYDYRVLECSWLLTESQAESMVNTFRFSPTLTGDSYPKIPGGRYGDIEIRLGSTKTGFYPAGPDYGDIDTFTGSLLAYSVTPNSVSPFRRFTVTASFSIAGYPSYTLPSRFDEGAFFDGYTRYPKAGFKTDLVDAIARQTTRSGAVKSVDSGYLGDKIFLEYLHESTPENIAYALNYFTTMGRGRTMLYDIDSHYFMAGPHTGSSTFTKTADSTSGSPVLDITDIDEVDLNNYFKPGSWINCGAALGVGNYAMVTDVWWAANYKIALSKPAIATTTDSSISVIWPFALVEPVIKVTHVNTDKFTMAIKLRYGA
jgi:hypothetical protein